MNAADIERRVREAIGDSCEVTNDHGVDLRSAVVPPQLIAVTRSLVQEGMIHDEVISVWLVLMENPESGAGYRIVASADGQTSTQ